MEIAFIIIVLMFVGILLLINFDDSLKSKLNIMTGLLFTIVILLAAIAGMLYPQYRNSQDIRDTFQESGIPDESGRRTGGSAGRGEPAVPGP
jgi:hypothetical protein